MLDDLTEDRFLGGALTIRQPRRGYRAGVDPVLLAASVPGDVASVLELGCGAGVASLCLAHRLPGVAVTALEVQPEYADLARQNVARSGLPVTVLTGDLAAMPAELRARRFDHVIANPPFFLRSDGPAASDPGRERALGEASHPGGAALADWVAAAARRVRDRGQVTFIHRAARLPDLIALFSRHLGSVEVLPLIPRRGRPAELVLIRGRKLGRAPFCLRDGLLIHQGARHDGDRADYTPEIDAVLRRAAALPFA